MIGLIKENKRSQKRSHQPQHLTPGGMRMCQNFISHCKISDFFVFSWVTSRLPSVVRGFLRSRVDEASPVRAAASGNSILRCAESRSTIREIERTCRRKQPGAWGSVAYRVLEDRALWVPSMRQCIIAGFGMLWEICRVPRADALNGRSYDAEVARVRAEYGRACGVLCVEHGRRVKGRACRV